MMRLLKLLRTDQRGASIVELGLVAPIFGGLLVGMTDISRAYSMKLRLEQAAQRAIETVQQQARSGNNYSALTTEASSGNGRRLQRQHGDRRLQARMQRRDQHVDHRGGDQRELQLGRDLRPLTISNSYTPMFTASYFPNHNSNGTVTVSGYAGLRVQ